MPSVFYDNPYNSTFFTTCCRVAICDDQQKCPRCGKDVYPFYQGMDDGERKRLSGGYYNYNTRLARMMTAKRNSYYG